MPVEINNKLDELNRLYGDGLHVVCCMSFNQSFEIALRSGAFENENEAENYSQMLIDEHSIMGRPYIVFKDNQIIKDKDFLAYLNCIKEI